MKTSTLLKKVERATDEKQKLIAQILAAPPNLQESLSEALSPEKKAVGQILPAIIDMFLEVSGKISTSSDVSPEKAFDSLMELLTSKELLEKFAPNDPLAAARLRGVQRKRDLLYQDGSPLTSEGVASLLQITRQGVDKRRKHGQLLGLSLGRRGYRYPVWQFQDGKVLPGLKQVLAELSEYDPWTQLMFFKTGDIRLGGATPLEKLQAGDIEMVVWAASCYGKPIAA
ncbi:conserved hypothetical protein [Gloeothece citriformis PCC 7424]|uniref:DNA-binding protein n=1 Tax=Gloeothece citriformis (strain PCC 7424) TaxID=65393 RepID=B7KA69_GLOC7|nr:hypothetical protein [Gloeothece citriformis]ACK72843.1 conserved hypothetical protein [Gloeothece citriformis PCC 7424]